MRQFFKHHNSIILIILLDSMLLLFNEIDSCAQANNRVCLRIIDTLVIKKPWHDAVKLHLLISVIDKQTDTLYMYYINKNVPSNQFIYNKDELQRYNNIGLIYVLENEKQEVIQANSLSTPSFNKINDEIQYSNSELIVNKHLKIKRKILTYERQHEYNISRIWINGEKTIEVFPLLKTYHTLQKGTYSLFFYYAFNDSIDKKPPTKRLWDKYKPLDYQIIKGNFVSNKIKLIIK